MTTSPLVLSLFPGIGLLDRAFEEEGFCVVRGPDVLWGGDIRNFHPPADRFEGIIGGPPCQCFSTLASLVRANGHEPRFGNLIPEYERCVKEARPRWFLMEEVPQAPIPCMAGYAIQAFRLNNAWLDSGDGYGEEQNRMRMFSFGRRYDDGPAYNLMRWIEQAALELPKAGTVTQYTPDNSQGAKGRVQVQAVVSKLDPVPVKICGSGKMKRSAVTGRGGSSCPAYQQATVTATHAGEKRPKGGKLVRYTFADACRLQGLPEDFLVDAPFTAQGKIKAVANGVPLPMGRAVARAVREAIGR